MATPSITDNRLELYNDGMTDRQIGFTLNIPVSTITSWRYRSKLPVNIEKRMITHEEYMELYEQNLNDQEIADKLGIFPSRVLNWRNKRHLLQNGGRKHQEYQTRMELYEQGKNDSEIARALRIPRRTVSSWRLRNGLPNNANKKVKQSHHKASWCWSCTRAYAKPDPYGCGFHRKEHAEVFDEAKKIFVTNSHNDPILVTIVTKCKDYQVSMRDLMDRQRRDDE